MIRTLAASIACAALLAACSISQNVRPVATSEVHLVCVKHNPDTFMKDFETEMQSQLKAKGMQARLYTGDAPAECRYRLEYTANWHWDMAMYLVFAQIRVFDRDMQIGEADYDARGGGFNMAKFGHTSDKLKALLDQLFPRAS